MLVTRSFGYALGWLLAAGAPFGQVSPHEWRQSNLSASDLRLSVPGARWPSDAESSRHEARDRVRISLQRSRSPRQRALLLPARRQEDAHSCTTGHTRVSDRIRCTP